MIVRKIEVDPVSNRRKVFLLALTAGICFAVFVGISLESPALPADGNNSTCTKLQQMMFPATFDAGPLDFLELGESLFSCVFVKISLANTMAMWILAGSALLIVLTQVSVIVLSIWLLSFPNCQLRLWNRFHYLSASLASNTSCSSPKIGFKSNIIDLDLFRARLRCWNSSTSAPNRFGACLASSANKTSSLRKIGFEFNTHYSIGSQSKATLHTHQLSQRSGQEIIESPMSANATAFEEMHQIHLSP